MSFRLKPASLSVLGGLLSAPHGIYLSAAWRLLASGTIAIDDPHEKIQGIPLIGWLGAGGMWKRLSGICQSAVPLWNGDPFPVDRRGPWPACPALPGSEIAALSVGVLTGCEALFACLVAAGADPWIPWPSPDSCDGEMDGFDLAVGWGSAGLVDACLRHPSCPPLPSLYGRRAWRSYNMQQSRGFSSGYQKWATGASSLVQMSAICGHAQVVDILLEKGFPLGLDAPAWHPLVLAQTSDVCEVLLRHGIRFEDVDAGAAQGRPVQTHWETLADVSPAHAATLQARRELMDEQLKSVQAARSKEEWVLEGLRYFGRGEFKAANNAWTKAAPDLAEKLASASPVVVAEALLRFSAIGPKGNSAIVHLALGCLSKTLSSSEADGVVEKGMAIVGAAIKHPASASLSPLSLQALSDMVWTAAVTRTRSTKALRRFSIVYSSSVLQDQAFDLHAGAQTIQALRNGLSKVQLTTLTKAWEERLLGIMKKDSRPAHSLTSILPLLTGLPLTGKSWDAFNLEVQSGSLADGLAWLGCWGTLLKSGLSSIVDVAQARIVELQKVTKPWDAALAAPAEALLKDTVPQGSESKGWERLHAVLNGECRANRLAKELPSISVQTAKGVRF